VHAEDRHHPRHAGGEQRQRIKGPLAYSQRPRSGVQRGGVEVTFGAG
jgi:hypothetical protein